LAELAGRIAALTSERDTIAGKASQQAVDLAVQAQRIEREHAAAEAARVETATVRVKIEAQAEQLADLKAANAKLTDAVDAERQARNKAERDAAVLTAERDAARVEDGQRLLPPNAAA
jgi:chromosome segregation ATPase